MTEQTREEPLYQALKQLGVLSDYASRSADEPVEWETAFAINEIVGALKRLENELLPAVINRSNNEDASAALHEIREEMRHIVYHIKDSQYLSLAAEQ